MMSRYGIEQEVRTRVASYHDQAVSALSATALADEVIAPLLDLTRRLETRTG
jgi:hypothetical protein